MRAPLAHFIQRDSVVFDVGAHAGQFTKLFARMAPAGRIYAFEPGSYALSILRAAVWFNHLPNVTVLPFALGDAASTLQLSVPIKPSGSVGFGLSHLQSADRGNAAGKRQGWHYRPETVDVQTVDQFVGAQHIDRLDFVKADIEGWELRMLAGAAEAIARFSPAFMIEVLDDTLARAGDSANGVFDFLATRGSRAFRYLPAEQHFVELATATPGDTFFCKREAHVAALMAG